MRLIDADALYEKTAELEAQALYMCEKTMNDEDLTEWRRWSAVLQERSAFKFDIADAPTIDAVSVVRCRECKYRETCEKTVWFDIGNKAIGSNIDFCSYGEERVDETE